jgi:outer membrane protein assembly factor BamB
MSPNDLIVIGLAPRVLALRKATGEVVWATELASTGSLTTVRVEGGRVYAGCLGEVTCLDLATGAVLWHNPLKGYGIHPVLFAGDGPAAASAAESAAGAAGAIGAAGA